MTEIWRQIFDKDECSIVESRVSYLDAEQSIGPPKSSQNTLKYGYYTARNFQVTRINLELIRQSRGFADEI